MRTPILNDTKHSSPVSEHSLAADKQYTDAQLWRKWGAESTDGNMIILIVEDRSPAAERADAHRALLRTIGWELIQGEVERRGHQVCLHQVCKFSTDRLPAGYPPMGDDDLPFDASKDGRG